MLIFVLVLFSSGHIPATKCATQNKIRVAHSFDLETDPTKSNLKPIHEMEVNCVPWQMRLSSKRSVNRRLYRCLKLKTRQPSIPRPTWSVAVDPLAGQVQHMCSVIVFTYLKSINKCDALNGNTHAASPSPSASASALLMQDVAHGCNLQTPQAFPSARLKCTEPGQAWPGQISPASQTMSDHVVRSFTANQQLECQMVIICSGFRSREARILNSQWKK